jgi:hypothetical protein
MSDISEYIGLRDRLIRLATSAGLEIKDSQGLTDAMTRAGVSQWFHGTLADDYIADKLHLLHSKRPELFEVPSGTAAHGSLDPAFLEWLGPARAVQWSSLSAVTRLGLHHQFRADPRQAPDVAAELTARYGDKDSAARQATPLERLRLHQSGEVQTGSRAGVMPVSPALQALPAQQRLAAAGAIKEAAHLRHERLTLQNSKGGGFNVESGRSARLQQIDARLEHLRQRFPSALAG